MNRFKEKTVLVTGAASGIGLATARRFLDEGARVLGAELVPLRADVDHRPAALSGLRVHRLSNLPGHTLDEAEEHQFKVPLTPALRPRATTVLSCPSLELQGRDAWT